jgi:uncharacterized membrane protein YhhN
MNMLDLWLPLSVAVLDWAAVARRWRAVEYVAKPAVMLLLLAWLWRQGAWPAPLWAFALGLTLSLAGDVLLMLPERFFLAGLVSFLLAHLAYIAGFLSGGRPPLGPTLLLAVPVAVAGYLLVSRVAAALLARGRRGLVGPVLAYGVVISLMVLSALTTLARPAWDPSAARLASLGAVLFLASDAILAWDRFVVPIRFGRLLNLVTYHLGQIALIAGAAAQFVR